MPRKLPPTRLVSKPPKKATKKPVLEKPLLEKPLREKLTRPPVEADPFADVEPLTQQLLQHHRSANIVSVETRAEQGRILTEIHESIPHGSWMDYVEQKAPFKRSTAETAIKLHRFRENHPALFEKLKTVILSVAHYLLERPVSDVDAFLSTTHVIPNTGAIKTPSAMTYPEVMALFTKKPAAPDPDEALLRRYRKAGRRTIGEIKSLIANRDALDPDDVADIYDDLLHALAELAHHFDLEP